MSVENIPYPVRRGCLESRIPSSLRGGTTKQSSNYQPFPDCFISFAMTGQGFRDTPGMSVENIPYPVWNPVRDDMSVENIPYSVWNPVRDDISVEDGMSVEDVTPSTETKSRFEQNEK
jgi:hypothetical protein